MNAQSLRAGIASIILLGLPIADFLRDGEVSEVLVGALLICAFGGGGFAADKALKARIRLWSADETERTRDKESDAS